VHVASIREVSTGQMRLLEPEHLIGRSPSCALHINERYVSAQHALLRWTGRDWELRDLGSRNGTFLNGDRLKPAEEVFVRAGSRIAFGKPEQTWEVVDDGAPGAMVVPVGEGEPVVLEGELLALPSSDDPRVTIYRSEGSWFLEKADESTAPLTNRQTFEIEGRVWRFCCVEDTTKTTLADSSTLGLEVRYLQLTFSVSADEEHVHLQMSCGGKTVDLGSRTHNYLLLTLARRRIADAAAGQPETACGWVYQDDFPNDPMMAAAQLNIDVFRIRDQFKSAGVLDAANIVERRPRTRQLRIGTGRLSVVRL
jgi:FHA domain